jgi:CheY-like chemotaxis protein
MRNKLILLVEDNPDDRLLTVRGLQRHALGCTIDAVADGQEALDYLFGEGAYQGRDAAVQPQLVLLDLNLPRLGGLEVLRAMRGDARTRRVPVVVLSSSDEQRDIACSYDLGANSYVRKSVDFGKFVDEARQVGTYWLEINAPW